MGRVSVKTVWKGTALLIFVMLQGLNVETTTASPNTSSPSTESQTSASSTPATTSSPSIESQISTSKPGVIRNLSVANITTSSVFLTWDEPFGNRSFFKLHLTDDKTNKTTNNTSYNITDLTAGVNYTFCISAVAADQSTEGETVCISQFTKPDVIRNLSVANITTSSVFLTWEEAFGNRSFFKLHRTDDKTNTTTNNTSYNITDLTAGVNYTFCISAVAADQSTEGETVCISQFTKPDVIRNLSVANITTSSVFLTWEEAFGNRSFFKLHRTDDKTNTTTNNTSYNITDLTAGVSYTFCISAVAADQSTEGETVCISQFTKPDVIRNLSVANITTSSVFLTWEEAFGNRSFFKLHRTDDKTNTTTNNTSYNITDLTAGVSYTFCISAVAADQSTEGETVCISQFTKPDVIRNLSVANITTSSVFLTWEEAFGNRSFFKLHRTDDKTNTTTNNTSYNITGLTAGVSYTFCISAVAADQSTEGETVCISQFTKPDVIRNLSVANITTSSVFLTWEEAFGNRSFFKLHRTDDKTNTTTNNTSYNITGLTAGVNYTFCISAVAADQSTEGETVCISQFTKPDVIRNLSVANITISSVFLTWEEAIGNRSFFKLHRTDDKTNTTTNNTSYNITGLTAGVSYTFCISAVAADQSTEGETVCISQFTKPDVIRNLSVANITISSVFLTWEEAIGNRSFFKLHRTDDKTNTTTNNTSYNITGLTAGVSYTFCISAVAADQSTEGETVCISQFTKPDVIRNLSVANITTSSVFLTWEEAFGNRSFFKLHRTDDKTNKTTNNTSYNITGLTAGVNYTFCISAVAADQSTEGETVCISQFTKPYVIRNLSVANITTSSVFLTWEEAFGNRSFFKLHRTDDKTNKTTNNTSYNITGLTAGVNYTFCISAVAADQSTEGETVCISQFTKPDVIRNLSVANITTSSVFLTWEEAFGNRSFFKLHRTDDKTNKTTNNTSYNITGLTAGVSYTFCISAVAADQSTEGETVCISQFTKPDVIRNLSVANITTSSVFLTWEEAFGNRSFFKLHRTDDKTNKTTNNTSYNITGLTAGVNYTFCISAVAADQSTEGETVCISQFTKPDVIRNLSVANITTSSVFLTWDKAFGNRSFFKLHRTDDKTNKTTNNTSYNITGLTAGVNYTFCISAVAADQSTEGETVCISQFTKPDVIRNLSVANITISSVFLTWDEAFGNRSFFKLHRTGDKTNKTTNNTSYNITDLTAGDSYTFCISAVAADQSTEGEPVCISQCTKPDVIRNLSVANITTSSVFLTWDKAFGNRSFFKLHRTDDKTNKTTNNTSYNITDLTAGVNYTFCISAVAADQSTEGETVCISQFTMPDVIRNLSVANITTSSVFLKWDEAFGNRSFFKLHRTDDKTNKTTNNTSYNITDLTAGVNYTFCISAVAADQSTEGETVCISQFTKPDVIRNLSVANITTSSVFLTWDEPVGNRSFFKVHRTDDKTNKTTNNTSYNITDLTAGVSYTFCISAVAADQSTEGETVCISKFTKPDVIRNLRVNYITTSSVFLTWNEPIGNRSFFKLHRSDDKTHKTTNNTSYNITGLTAGVSYTFCISAVAADQSTEGEPVCISQCTKPDVIRNLSVANITTSSVFLTWDEPVGNRYFFKVHRTDDKTNKTTNNTSYNITGLTAGVNYTFCISAVAADQSTEGEAVCISQFTKPNRIINLTVSEITTSSVCLTWDEPVGNRSFFKIQWMGDKTNGGSTTGSSYNITGLTAGVNFTLNITAVAADNSTEGESVLTSKYTKPDVIMNLTAVDITTSSIFLNWTKPNGQSSRYRVEYENKNVTTENTSIKITDLIPGAQYTFKVFAVAADNVTEGRANQILLYTNSPPNNTPMIVGVVLAVICFLFIITLILFFYSRRQTKKQCPDIPIQTISNKVNIGLRIEDYEEHFKQKHKDSNCGFAEEYEELKTVGIAQSKNIALAVENKPKNRYSNVLPYDASRVKLSVCGSPFDDYINANYIPGYNSRKEFIAAQGPLPVTVNEFWRMVWEKNVFTIVMLTRCNEMGRVKCEKYWPSGTNHYQNISVTTTSEIDLESWTIRDFRIKNVKTAETRYVRQFHFTAWPDHGVPQTTEVLIDFRHLVREHMDQYSRHSPTVVHCSAGVGRTGTFIAIDHLTFQIERDSMVDIYGIVNDMRIHRPLMVQTEEQYVYLHQCAYDIIRSRTGTNVDLIYQNAEAISIYQNLEYHKS
ncbi:receptor-type tyrosine-protein phosphatase eta isoform X7 [Carassius auratus]|uniref:protein-tyrosine-phosphatase n=1 Tax=Carassius auratus TaxID=7957 RepID=A0A6P6JGQ7_CARAU|nr:receptor-type tyrosine-protein phosphatase eta-like isoform X7 [Carassius auratus]